MSEAATMTTMIAYQANVPAMKGLAAALAIPLVNSVDALADHIRENKPEAVLMSIGPANSSGPKPLAQWSYDDWMASADAPQFAMLSALNAVHAALDGRDLSIILIGPAIAQTGVSGHVALATASEGQRGLMKSIARQWGPQIRLVWLSLWPPLLYPEIAETDLPEQCELGPYTPSLGQRPTWEDVAQGVRGAALCCGAMTGQTMMIDGGEWMLP